MTSSYFGSLITLIKKHFLSAKGVFLLVVKMVEKGQRRGENRRIDSSQPRSLADLHGKDRRAARKLAKHVGIAIESAPVDANALRPGLSGEFRIGQ